MVAMAHSTPCASPDKDDLMTRLHPLIAGPRARASGRRASLVVSTALTSLALCALISLGTPVQAQTLPTGGTVTAGGATITTSPDTMTITQSSQNTAINWQSFSIGQGGKVDFVQPNTSAVALNRVLGPDPSTIFGSLTANGRVFLINPNGVLFAQGSQVNVGGLVASTLGLSDADFMAGDYRFSGSAGGVVLNQGAITANGGFVALLGGQVSNAGTIQARLGTVALAAGQAITLDVGGDGLLNLVIDQGAANALVQNGGLLQADGGKVLMTAQGAGDLLRTVVNNTGVVQARTIGERNGTIRLLGDMPSGTLNLAGVLDTSAPDGGDGGSIETSAGRVNIAPATRVTAAAPSGVTGTWLIEPADFTIGAGGNISGATLSAQLVTTNVVISTMSGPGAGLSGSGDIHVNDAITWTASSTPTTLTLNANRDININAAITATNGNLVACCGRDVNVNAAITTVNGSVLLNAGQNVNVYHAITTTDGNIALCAGHDVHIDAAITLTRGSIIVAQSLGLPVGLTLIAGADGSGPGVGGGAIIFSPLAPRVTVTVAPVTINYNPASYAAPSDFSTRFTLTEGAALKQRMLLFPDGSRVFDGSTATTLVGFRTTAVSGLPTDVTLVAGPDAIATFDSAAAGADVGITYSGYTLTGANADQYALAGFCCVSTFRTQGTISQAPVTPPPVVPPIVPPVVPPVTPPVTPPVIPPVVPPVVPPVTPPVVPPVTPPVTPPVVPPVVPPVTPPVTPPVVPPVTPPPVTPPAPPAPAPQVSIFYPILTVTPTSQPLPDLALAVVEGGVQMPPYGPTPLVAPVEAAIAPANIAPVTPAPAVPVYPRKQDRN